MSKIQRKLIWCVILLTVGSSCKDCTIYTGTNTGNSDAPKAAGVHLHNCTVINGPTEPPSGRAYNVFARLNGSSWGSYGQLNANVVAPTDCRTNGQLLDVDFKGQAGNWEIRAVKIFTDGSCDSSLPDVTNACGFITHAFVGDSTFPWADVDFTTADQ